MLKRNWLFIMMVVMTAGSLFAQNSIIDRPVAIVKLTKTDVISQKKLNYNVGIYEQQIGKSLSMEEKEQVLETLINQMLVFQAAERDNVVVTDEQALQAGMNQMMQQIGQPISEEQYKKIILDQTGMDYEVYKENIKNQLVLEKYVTEKKRDFLIRVSTPTNEEIELFYRQNEAKFLNPEMVRFSHIFFGTRGLSEEEKSAKKALAEDTYRKIQSGDATFLEMVREVSDDKNSLVRDGDIGSFIDRSDNNIAVFGGDFLNTIFDMDLNKLSPVVESGQGYHILKVTQHTDKKFLELDDPVSPVQTQTVRQYIGNVIGMQKQQQAFQQAAADVVKELSEEAEIQRFPENIQ